METQQPRRILVTGGAGYVGSVLVPKLLDQGHPVTVFDRFYFGEESLAAVKHHASLKLIKGDVRDSNALKQALSDVDTVIYLSDLSNDPSCELREELSRDINGRAVQNAALACKKHGVRDFLYFSSCSVYGAGGDRIHTEDSITNPVSLYAQLKMQTEEFLLRQESDGFRPVIFRNATLFGLSPRMRFDLAVNIMTLFGLRDKRIFIIGGGSQWRPFLHLADLAEVTVRALEHDFAALSGEVINVGGNDLNYQVSDLAKEVAGALPGVQLEHAPGDADRRSYRVDFAKLGRLLDFTPTRTVTSAVEEIAAAINDGTLADTEDSRYYNVRRMRELMERPAVLGGEKARSSFLPFCLPTVGEEEEQEVIQAMRSGWITTGPRKQCFEAKLGSYINNPNTMAVSSCTAALHLALTTCGVGPGDEVITSPITFTATANVIVHAGATPVFADVDPGTLMLDPERAEAAITPRTKAIIPVDLGGQSVDIDAFMDIGRRHGISIIQDAAHSVGATYKDAMVGEVADFTCFSFYPTKNMTTIEGGAIAFKDPAHRSDLASWALHGLSKDAWKRYDPNPEADAPELNGSSGQQRPGRPATDNLHWDVLYPGYKYNMTDIQAALGLHQLDKLETFIRQRDRYARIYLEAFRSLPGIEPLEIVPWGRQSWHLLIVQVDPELSGLTRDELIVCLKAENIGTGVHFRPVHLSSYYRHAYGFEPGLCPIAEKAGERIISLPLYPTLNLNDVYLVIETVQKLVKWYSASPVEEARR